MVDVAIIGAGPAGYVAGIRASQLGLNACIIEKEKAGGVCLNVGCIPSKSFIHQAGIFASQKALKQMGIRLDDSGFDFNKVIANSRSAVKTLVNGSAVKTLVNGVERLLRKNKVKLITGTAKIAAKNAIVVDDGTELYAKNIVIATGSRPTQLPGFEFDEKQILSSNGMLKLQKLPENLLILGAGAIGCEFAYIMNCFGVEVLLVEMAEHILPFEDPDTVRVLAKTFADNGIKILTEARAISIEKTSKSVTVTVEEKAGSRKKLKAEMALCVFGRTPNTDNIGLENIGIKTERGYIPIGDYYQTKAKGVFAVGDIITTPQLAHVASKEAEIAIEYIAGHRSIPEIDPDTIVSAVYCEPEIAGFGLQEKEAQDNKIPYKKTVIPFVGVGKAIAIGKTAGLVKILSDPRINEIFDSL
jgi:dihydrolipoamide dehydrogenase